MVEEDFIDVDDITLLPVFTVMVTLYQHKDSGTEKFFVRTNDQHGHGLTYQTDIDTPKFFYQSYFERMMEIATKELVIRVKENPPKRSTDPRQTSLTSEKDLAESREFQDSEGGKDT